MDDLQVSILIRNTLAVSYLCAFLVAHTVGRVHLLWIAGSLTLNRTDWMDRLGRVRHRSCAHFYVVDLAASFMVHQCGQLPLACVSWRLNKFHRAAETRATM